MDAWDASSHSAGESNQSHPRKLIEPYIGSHRLIDLETIHVRRWIDRLVREGFKASTVHAAVAVLFSSFRNARLLGMIDRYGLRHTSASLELAAGTHPKIVADRLGHASIEITLDLYSHVDPALRRAVDVAPAGQLFDDETRERATA